MKIPGRIRWFPTLQKTLSNWQSRQATAFKAKVLIVTSRSSGELEEVDALKEDEKKTGMGQGACSMTPVWKMTPIC